MTNCIARLLGELYYSIPGLSDLLRLVGRGVAALLPSSVDIGAVAVGIAHASWYATQALLAAAVIVLVTLAAWAVGRVIGFLIDRPARGKAAA